MSEPRAPYRPAGAETVYIALTSGDGREPTIYEARAVAVAAVNAYYDALNERLTEDIDANVHPTLAPAWTEVEGPDAVVLDGTYTRAMLRRIIEAMDEAERGAPRGEPAPEPERP